MSVKERVKKYCKHLEITVSQFEKSIDVSNGYVNSISKNIGIEKLNLIIENYSNLNIEWLLTGKVPMLKYDTLISNTNTLKEDKAVYNLKKTIPLVDAVAIGGFSGADFAISEIDVKEHYVIPKFNNRKVDFMIEVNGSSMYPKYNSGDVVACRMINESRFIQWNKVHVIATKEQGVLIKRLKKSKEANHLLAVSDNKDYDPFDIPKEDINNIALVVGVIRLE